MRPHAVLVWLFLLAAVAGASAIPLIGPSLVLFLPALAGWAILIVNAATGFDAKLTAAAV